MTELIRQSAAIANAQIYQRETPRVYIEGAPHIKHRTLRLLFDRLAGKVYNRAARNSVQPTMLDLGTGEGSLTRWFLQHGAGVTAVDIAENRLISLKARCAEFADRLEVRCEDINQTLANVTHKYDIIAINSVLHHVPDYLDLLTRAIAALAPGGQVFSFQEPMRYDRLGLFTRKFSALAYYSWRITRGEIWAGLKRFIRRHRGIYLDDCTQDNADYHATRNGVDQDAIADLLTSRSLDCTIVTYFSTQSRLFQKLGSLLRLKNTFAVIARKEF